MFAFFNKTQTFIMSLLTFPISILCNITILFQYKTNKLVILMNKRKSQYQKRHVPSL